MHISRVAVGLGLDGTSPVLLDYCSLLEGEVQNTVIASSNSFSSVLQASHRGRCVVEPRYVCVREQKTRRADQPKKNV